MNTNYKTGLTFDDILKKKITSDASHILNEMEDPIEKIVSVSDTYLKNK